MAEVELKFELPPGAHAAFRRLAPMAQTQPRAMRLHARYFDTPDFALRNRSMALRLRRENRKWVQTLKAGRSGAGGLHSRGEWESVRPDATLDLTLLRDTPLDGAQDLQENLAEVFQVDVRRTTWEIEVSPGNRVEVALDRGEVSRGGGSESVSEVEIESIAGDPMAVFELADRLLDAVPLQPSAVTKAQRGYRLAGEEREGPAKAHAVQLDPAWSLDQAARAVAGAALEQLQANEPGVIANADPEYLHQFRVALRRLRSGLRIFDAALDPEFAARMKDELKWIAGLTGPARDWDVFAAQTLPAILEEFGSPAASRSIRAKAGARRKAAHEALREALSSPRHARLVLALARWLASPPQAGTHTLGDFARRALRKRHRKLVSGSEGVSSLTPSQRHELRLDAKRLRYALEGFESLFGQGRLRRYRELLGEIQDDLGRANDAAVAGRLLAEVKASPALAQFARGWLAAQTHSSVELLERHAARLGQAKLPRLKA